MENISFVTLIAYDYKYAFQVIKSYYEIADEIILGIDKDRITWSGNPFNFDVEEFNRFLLETDTAKKIKILQGNFHHLPSPIANDTYERRALSNACKPGNWIVQIDADETLLNPKEFVEFINKNKDSLDGCALKANWITVFKSFGDSCLVIDVDAETDGKIFVGTKKQNAYTMCRDTAEMAIQTPLRLLHYSWGRTREELKQKLENWGHSKDFDTNAYLSLWDKVTIDNYKEFKNLHPLHGPHWPKLKMINVNDIISKQGEKNEI